MAGELAHITKGTSLTQAEFEHIDLHACNSQATGDLIYASSATQLSRLAIGAADTVFTCNGTIPAWSATPILNNAVAKGTWTASGTWTIPAVTLGGAIDLVGNNLNNYVTLNGRAGYDLNYYVGAFAGDRGHHFWTRNADNTADIERLKIMGYADVSVATWANVTHTGLNITSGQVLQVAGTQVVGARVVDARCDDVANSGDATTDGLIDSLRDAMITHGLVAAA